VRGESTECSASKWVSVLECWRCRDSLLECRCRDSREETLAHESESGILSKSPFFLAGFENTDRTPTNSLATALYRLAE
jgi:hypothetical protein